VTYLIDEVPLTSSLDARTWCMVLRLLNFADPAHVVHIETLVTVLHEILVAAEELQARKPHPTQLEPRPTIICC